MNSSQSAPQLDLHEKRQEKTAATTDPGMYVEMSDNHRYIRFQEIIRISFNGLLTSYKAFDTTDGVEILWHKISIPEINEDVKEKFRQFMADLTDLGKESFVENVAYWFSLETTPPATTCYYLNIITTNYETIREFISKVKTLRWKIIKKWCRQVLQALLRLHQHHPSAPIIHRYISCAHIYIDGGLGTIAVGDIWLSFQSDAFNLARSFNDVTRPNFDDPKGDVYALGLCILEMVGKDTSSKKKSSQPLVYSKEYIASVLPRINNESAKDFIQSCLLPTEERPTIMDLQSHVFLQTSTTDDEEVKLLPKSQSEPSLVSIASLDFPTRERMDSTDESSGSKTQPTSSMPSPIAATPPVTTIAPPVDTVIHPPSVATATTTATSVAGIGFRDTHIPGIRVVSISKQVPTSKEYQLQISIPAELFQNHSLTESSDKEVEFSLDFETDNAMSVAKEMIEELQLTISMDLLAEEIARSVENYDQQQQTITSNTTTVNNNNVTLNPSTNQEKVKEEVVVAVVVSPPTDMTSATNITGMATPPLVLSPGTSRKVPNNNNTTNTTTNRNTSRVPEITTDSSPSSSYFNKSLSEEDVSVNEKSTPLTTTPSPKGNPPIVTSFPVPVTPPPPAPTTPYVATAAGTSIIRTSSKSNDDPQVTNNSNHHSTEEMVVTTRGRTSSNASIDSTTTTRFEDNNNTILSYSIPSTTSFPKNDSSASLISSTSATNLLTARANLTIDLTADLILQKVLEKIDQEARAARRAFEARIQKLINIQEKCEEDLLKLKNELTHKMGEFDKREENTRQKRDNELLKLRNDFEQNVRELRMKLQNPSIIY